MAGIKRGKWIQAKRFRVTKKNGRTVIEVQRTVKRKTRTNAKRKGGDFQARYKGEYLGSFRTAASAQKAIERARKRDQAEERAYRKRGPYGY